MATARPLHPRAVSTVVSMLSAPAPVRRSSGSSRYAAQQWTIVARSPAAASTVCSAGNASWTSTARSRPDPDAVGSRPSSTAGSDGLVELQDEVSTWGKAAQAGEQGPHPLGQRFGEIATGPGVDESPLAPVQPDRCGQRPRTGDRDLERAGIPGEGRGNLAEDSAPERRRAPRVGSRPIDEPPPGRLQVDREVDEQSGRAADEVPAVWSATGQPRYRLTR